jgi:hypothetical protein
MRFDQATSGAQGGDLGNLLRLVHAFRMIRGVSLDDVALPAGGTKTVTHKLGRKPIGCTVTWATKAIPAFYILDADEKTMTFTSISSSTVNLWVW